MNAKSQARDKSLHSVEHPVDAGAAMRDHSVKQHTSDEVSAWLHACAHVKGHLCHGAWIVLVLTALTQFLHSLHLEAVHQMDHFFTAHVVKRLHRMPWADQREPEPGPGALAVQLLEISPDLRLIAFEEAAPTIATVQRLQGVRPISREAMNALLGQLATCLETGCQKDQVLMPTARILALDVDLMPLPGEPKRISDEMISTLNRLRQHLHIVLIVLGRESSDALLVRNDFIRRAQCTPLAYSPPSGTSAAPGGLFLASPRLLARASESPLLFASRQLDPLLKEPKAPGWFPSLGNLSYLLWRYQGVPTGTDPDSVLARQALTQMCNEVGPTPASARPVLEDELVAAGQRGESEDFVTSRWRTSYYNWRLLDSERLHFTPLMLSTELPVDQAQQTQWPSLALADAQRQLASMPLKAPVLMLSIEGSAGHDKFPTPAVVPVPITGASIHALQALSADQEVGGKPWHVLVSVLIDGMLGMLFLAAWALIGSLLALRQKLWPRCMRLLSVLVPPILAGLIFWTSLWIAAALMRYDIWFNPVYVLLGMTVHAYIEGWQHDAPPKGKSHAWGLHALREWRKSGGWRAPATKHDALLAAGMRWIALLLGLCGLTLNIFHTLH